MVDGLWLQAPDGAENLVKMHEELQTKRAVTEQLSRDLEDPANLIRLIHSGFFGAKSCVRPDRQ